MTIVAGNFPFADSRWLNHFDPQAAYQAVIDHVETLPSSRYERHTMRAYTSSLADFLRFAGAAVHHRGGEQYAIDWRAMSMPARALVAAYIADRKRAGLTSKTVTRYMASVRLFIAALETQQVAIRDGADLMFIMESQRQFRLAAAVKNPKPDTTSHRPALETYGQRLTFGQVNQLFESFSGRLHRLDGKRDLALLYLGINSGLRAAELSRLTLASITPGRNCYEVRVRGKRNNIDPVGIDTTAQELLIAFVEHWNARLPTGDPRCITPERPIFQPLIKGNTIPALGVHGFDPDRGLSPRAILHLVERVTRAALNVSIKAHDLRRTCAKLMRDNGFEWDQIRAQLRHNSIATTEKYVGQEQDLSRSLLSTRLCFSLPLGDTP